MRNWRVSQTHSVSQLLSFPFSLFFVLNFSPESDAHTWGGLLSVSERIQGLEFFLMWQVLSQLLNYALCEVYWKLTMKEKLKQFAFCEKKVREDWKANSGLLSTFHMNFIQLGNEITLGITVWKKFMNPLVMSTVLGRMPGTVHYQRENHFLANWGYTVQKRTQTYIDFLIQSFQPRLEAVLDESLIPCPLSLFLCPLWEQSSVLELFPEITAVVTHTLSHSLPHLWKE